MNNTSGIARIGITMYISPEEHLPPGYIEGIEKYIGGEVVPISRHTPLNVLLPLVISLDGMIFSGGGDIDPTHYGQVREPECGTPNAKRDQLEIALFDLIRNRDIPVLGICRGIQLINVMLGGTLKQHVSGHQQPDGVTHWHNVDIAENTRLHDIIGSNELMVNSYHHQMIDRVGEGLIVSAHAEDGGIEAVELPGERFLMGVQWHPEKTLDDADSYKIFEAMKRAIR